MLAIYDCSGNSIQCNDDYNSTTFSSLTVYLSSGSNYILALEAYALLDINVRLNFVIPGSVVVNENTQTTPFVESTTFYAIIGSLGGIIFIVFTTLLVLFTKRRSKANANQTQEGTNVLSITNVNDVKPLDPPEAKKPIVVVTNTFANPQVIDTSSIPLIINSNRKKSYTEGKKIVSSFI